MNILHALALAAFISTAPSTVAAQSDRDVGPDLTPSTSPGPFYAGPRYYFDAPEPDIERFEQLLDTRDGDRILSFLGERAAEGAAWAMMQLGAFYAEGEFVEYSPVMSLNWFAMAAREGEAKAALILGAMYTRGNVITADPEKASYWLAEAKRLGDYKIKRDVLAINEKL